MQTDTITHAQTDPQPARSARADILAGIAPDPRQLEAEAAAVLADYGLSITDAFRLLLLHIVQEQALPFPDIIPNAETIAAMEAAERSETEPVTLAELRAMADAED